MKYTVNIKVKQRFVPELSCTFEVSRQTMDIVSKAVLKDQLGKNKNLDDEKTFLQSLIGEKYQDSSTEGE